MGKIKSSISNAYLKAQTMSDAEKKIQSLIVKQSFKKTAPYFIGILDNCLPIFSKKNVYDESNVNSFRPFDDISFSNIVPLLFSKLINALHPFGKSNKLFVMQKMPNPILVFDSNI